MRNLPFVLLFGLALLITTARVVEAQQDQFVVRVATANVREAPSASSSVIARLTRESSVRIVRDLGDWIQVEISTGTAVRYGYVHRTVGFVARSAQPTETPLTESGPKPQSEPAPPTTPLADPPASTVPITTVSQRQPGTTIPAQTISSTAFRNNFAVGGRAGGFALGLGASVRMWTHKHIGVEMQLSRYSVGYAFAGVQAGVDASVLQFAPVVLYRFDSKNVDDDDLSLRPYVGGGINIFRTSLSSKASGYGQTVHESESASDIGFQAIGGVELRFKELRGLAVSADLGYYSTGTALAGYRVGGMAISAAAHWYVR